MPRRPDGKRSCAGAWATGRRRNSAPSMACRARPCGGGLRSSSVEIEIRGHCDGFDEPRGPLSPVGAEGGPRHLCPPCFRVYLAREVRALTERVEAMEGRRGGEADGRPNKGMGSVLQGDGHREG